MRGLQSLVRKLLRGWGLSLYRYCLVGIWGWYWYPIRQRIRTGWGDGGAAAPGWEEEEEDETRQAGRMRKAD
eukprot:753541-Hanusia_phi.AAC.4